MKISVIIPHMDKSVLIHITGVVQGVGFRPFVYNLAGKHGLKGYCLNDSEGVTIEAEGVSVDKFIDELRSAPPPLSRIETFSVSDNGWKGYADFTIRESVANAARQIFVSPDISICADCTRELLDPQDRRFLYPFINCTNCGPRYSIVKDIPYDRPGTTMAPFEMCPECSGEYFDPSNRRFHAQPNACAECGPRVWLSRKGTVEPDGSETNYSAIIRAQKLLKEGMILAIKGLGGFHLACDATNDAAVRRLREGKRRSAYGGPGASNKPFAVMAPDADAVKRFARLGAEEEKILAGTVRPITLLEKLTGNPLSGYVAPDNSSFGVMLPYTPEHRLLFRAEDASTPFTALVMTSGNLADEPIVVDNTDAAEKLSEIADGLLLHDREIYMRVDDSITRVERYKPRVLRRARGYTPAVIDLGTEAEEVLACGAELKSTFCITKGTNAIVSQHIGDLKNLEELDFFKESLANIKKTFRSKPEIVAHDMHPDYLSTSFALEYAEAEGIPPENVIAVQHHHAHIVSCMIEHGLAGPVLGVAFDGAGYGDDGTIWGGEFLIAGLRGYTRAAHLACAGLPGGDMAAREPWRMALSYIYQSLGDKEAERVINKLYSGRLEAEKSAILLSMLKCAVNTPLTSSAGRLFDAVSSMLGIRDVITFEGEAAMELEHRAAAGFNGAYPFGITGTSPLVVDTSPLIRSVIEDIGRSKDCPVISGKFHQTVADIVRAVATRSATQQGIEDVVLSGGVFQNRLLTGLTVDALESDGFRVWTQARVPANDGGISLGQAGVALERIKRNKDEQAARP